MKGSFLPTEVYSRDLSEYLMILLSGTKSKPLIRGFHCEEIATMYYEQAAETIVVALLLEIWYLDSSL